MEDHTETESADPSAKKKTPLELKKEQQQLMRQSRGGKPRGGDSSGGVKANAGSHSTKPTMPLKTGNKGGHGDVPVNDVVIEKAVAL